MHDDARGRETMCPDAFASPHRGLRPGTSVIEEHSGSRSAVITVSTDGSCLVNPGGAIGWAWINHDGSFDSGGAVSGTNQVAELTALLQAVRSHPGAEPLLIESDSQYAIKCASEWVVAWKRKGWRTAGGQPVKNLELVQAIDRAITERAGPVRFRWVRGHVGDPFNERADQLAGLAAQDWAAGRGDLDGTLVPELGDPTGSPVRPAPSSVPAATKAGATPPDWGMDTLFD